MKPLRARIREAAASAGIGEQVIEKDYALSYILAGIAAEPEISGAIVFKGGTALKKLFFGDYRFSEDLDFSALDSPRGDDLELAVRRAVAHSGNLLSEYGAFTLEAVRYIERDPHPFGQEAFVIRVGFPWHPSPLCRIKLEISHDEPVLLTPDLRPLIHEYEERLNVNVRCYRLEEIVAEKLRCLLQTQKKLLARGWNRPRARDYYDLWRLLNQFGASIDKTLIPSLLEQKCAHRNVGYSCVQDFFTRELMNEATIHWNSNLRPFVSELPPCDIVIDDLRGLVRNLLAPPE
ncbi:MAG: nucleotidyl transferase AbiEii/AbiGii toxin family protein [Armatimonadota bacterium]